MKSISEKEKKLLEALDKLKNLENIKPHKILELENLTHQKNQLEIEKKEIEESIATLTHVLQKEQIYLYLSN